MMHSRNSRRVVVMLMLGCGILPSLWAAGEMSQDELRMREQLVAVSQGKGAVADLRIELLDGGAMVDRMATYEIAQGRVVSRIWDRPGVPEKRSERPVSDAQVHELLKQLMAQQYWTFQGTRFIPDAPMFLFRFWYKGLKEVSYRCDVEEYAHSPERFAIRAMLLNFVSNAPSTTQP